MTKSKWVLPLSDGQLEEIYEAAWINAPPSIGWDIIADFLGFFIMDFLGEYPEDLLTPNSNLEGFADVLSEEIFRLADDHNLAPFDGTLAEHLEEGDTEYDWLIREDLMPFIINWRTNVLAMSLVA